MRHIECSIRELRSLYKHHHVRPCKGAWFHFDVEEGLTYQCPLYLIYGLNQPSEIRRIYGIPTDCTWSFVRGWDNLPVTPPACQQCYELGKKLSQKLNPKYYEVEWEEGM
jgi:hypothetical protein